MIPPKLLDARSLEMIEQKALAAPEGPYVCRDIGPCHQLLAGVTLDPRGRPVAIAAGRPVPVVLETREGRMFLETCREDALGLLGHVAALEAEKARNLEEFRAECDAINDEWQSEVEALERTIADVRAAMCAYPDSDTVGLAKTLHAMSMELEPRVDMVAKLQIQVEALEASLKSERRNADLWKQIATQRAQAMREHGVPESKDVAELRARLNPPKANP